MEELNRSMKSGNLNSDVICSTMTGWRVFAFRRDVHCVERVPPRPPCIHTDGHDLQ